MDLAIDKNLFISIFSRIDADDTLSRASYPVFWKKKSDVYSASNIHWPFIH